MEIDRKLNVVIPIEGADGKVSSYVHATPILKEVFNRYFLELSKTFALLYGEGLGYKIGPRVARLALEKISRELGTWDGVGGAKEILIAEIERNSHFVGPGSNGWEVIPYREAVDRKLISEDDVGEVENAIAFFIVASSMHKKTEIETILEGAGKLWDLRPTSSNVTAFAASLKTSTPVVPSGVTAGPSSIPR